MSFTRRPRSADLTAGVITAGFGSAVLVHVRTFPQLPGGQPGPALFPGIVAALMIVFGLVLAVQSFRGTRASEGGAEAPPSDAAAQDASARLPLRPAVVNAGAVVAGVAFYILLADTLGFVPTMLILLVALMWRLGARPLVAVGAAAATTAFALVVFREVLLVPLPSGPLGL